MHLRARRFPLWINKVLLTYLLTYLLSMKTYYLNTRIPPCTMGTALAVELPCVWNHWTSLQLFGATCYFMLQMSCVGNHQSSLQLHFDATCCFLSAPPSFWNPGPTLIIRVGQVRDLLSGVWQLRIPPFWWMDRLELAGDRHRSPILIPTEGRIQEARQDEWLRSRKWAIESYTCSSIPPRFCSESFILGNRHWKDTSRCVCWTHAPLLWFRSFKVAEWTEMWQFK